MQSAYGRSILILVLKKLFFLECDLKINISNGLLMSLVNEFIILKNLDSYMRSVLLCHRCILSLQEPMRIDEKMNI